MLPNRLWPIAQHQLLQVPPPGYQKCLSIALDFCFEVILQSCAKFSSASILYTAFHHWTATAAVAGILYNTDNDIHPGLHPAGAKLATGYFDIRHHDDLLPLTGTFGTCFRLSDSSNSIFQEPIRNMVICDFQLYLRSIYIVVHSRYQWTQGTCKTLQILGKEISNLLVSVLCN